MDTLVPNDLEQGEGHFSVAVGALGRMLDEVLVHV